MNRRDFLKNTLAALGAAITCKLGGGNSVIAPPHKDELMTQREIAQLYQSSNKELAKVRNQAGRVFFADGINGSDLADGVDPSRAFQTIGAALAQAQSGDTVSIFCSGMEHTHNGIRFTERISHR